VPLAKSGGTGRRRYTTPRAVPAAAIARRRETQLVLCECLRNTCYTPVVANPDKSNGYEEIASIFIAGRGQNTSGVGASVVAEWSRMLPRCASVLELGCGTGVPISQALIECGFNVYGIDASASMVTAFRNRFPTYPIQWAAVEDSEFFGRTFDGVVSWGSSFCSIRKSSGE
jgi:SAM-dependent methyltransferase